MLRVSNNLRLAVLLVIANGLLSLSASSYAQGTAAVILVPDPTLGITRSTLSIPAGWQGQAHVDRTSDPLSNGAAVVTADLSSADGKSRIMLLPVKFWTIGTSRDVAAHMPGNPLAQQNAALTRFTSTVDLMARSIVPSLGLTGEMGLVSGPTAQDRKAMDGAKGQMRAQGVPNPIFDLAVVTIHSGKRETTVLAVTQGANAGTPQEGTWTEITLVTGPVGQTQPVLQTFQDLPKAEANPQWLQADQQYYRMRQEKQAREQQANNDQINADTQRIVGMGQANVAAIERQGTQRHAAWIEQQQRNSDNGALFRGYLSSSDTSFKWCSSSSVQYTINSAVPPGAGYRRCD